MSKEVVTKLLQRAIEEGASDPAYWCRFFLQRWFPSPMPPFHLGLLALFTRKVGFLDKYPDAHEFLLNEFKYMADPADPESLELPVFELDSEGRMRMIAGDNNAVIIPRGFSKTTLENAANLHELCTDGSTFCVYVSESSPHAERQLGNIKRQLETNSLLVQAYGNLVPSRSDSERWGAKEIQLLNGAILIALGRGSQVRGLNYDGRRPNRILLDDVEDKESVSTDEQRKKVSDWFYGDVVPAGNEMEAGYDEDDVVEKQDDLQITVIGTLLGADALLMTLSRDPTFNTVKFGARLRAGKMLWDRKMSEPTYLRKRERFKRVGKLAEFAREYDSVIRVAEDALFQFDPARLYIMTPRAALIQVAIALDPAIGEDKRADNAAMVVAGRRDDGMLWILDEWGGQGKTPRDKINALFDMVRKWSYAGAAPLVGIEAVAYQKALIYLAKEEMARRQMFFVVQAIYQGKHERKVERINGILQPRYANGYIKHNKPLPMLESQLQDFPNGKVDFPDAAAMALTLLGETQMLAAPEGSVETDDYAPIDDVFEQLYSGNETQIFTPSPSFADGRYGRY